MTMTDFTLEQKRVLVVGGSSGIGLAVVKLAQQKGAKVIVASRGATERMAALPSPLNAVETHSFDITAPKASETLFESIGTIDHLIAAVRPEVHSAPFMNVNVDDSKRAFETKFWGQC